MGTYTSYHGTLAIEPPLTWPEIQAAEAWTGHPDHCNVEGFRSRRRNGTRLVVSERSETIQSGEYAGAQVVVRWCDGVRIVGEELGHDVIMSDLRDLARQFGATHRFTGVLECRHDHPDVETPFRVRIVGTAVEEIWPVMFWPDDPEVVQGLREVVAWADPAAHRMKVADAVLMALTGNYAKERRS